jgi:hypothetical protein
MKKIFLAMMLCFVVGCDFISPGVAIISAGVMWYKEREARKYYNTELGVMHTATKNVLEELKLPIVDEQVGEGTVFIKADAGDRFKITLDGVRENITKVSIVINLSGDRAYAEMIYRHLDAQQGVKTFYTGKEIEAALKNRPRLLQKK